MIKNSAGQSLLEALFVVVFTTVIMFAFLQICITAVDDMTLNEAAFAAMRSAAVAKPAERAKEAESRVKNYLLNYYYSLRSVPEIDIAPGSFKYSDKETVSNAFRGKGGDNESEPYDEQKIGSENGGSGKAVELYAKGEPDAEQRKKWDEDYSGHIIRPHTAKIYYFTRVMFGSLTAKSASKRDIRDSISGIPGSRRYQSSRSRMVPSPDSDYYHKAYPGAKNFDE
ncbi:MAG: hypothetical protein LBR69_05575 [Endomicrobium sp.]|jgi:hypothetical protein|nr:hypothetical protein [Endomicrobium sp.]